MTYVQKLLIGSVSIALLAAASVWSTAPAPREPLATQPRAAESPPSPAATAPVAAMPSAPKVVAPVPTPVVDKEANEGALMALLRQLRDSDPVRAIELAREGNERFPDSADAPERHSILIHALAAQNRPSEARGEAEHMVNHYPDSTWVREIEAFTGAHRRRNIRVRDDGQLEYYN